MVFIFLGYKLKQFYKFLPKSVQKVVSGLKLIIREPKLVAARYKNNQNTHSTIVILSFPRTGSSWFGSILGTADNARYMREPITTSFYYIKKQTSSVFTKEKCENWRVYSKLINDALDSKISLLDKVIPFPKQWFNSQDDKVTVIKEINPLIFREFMTNKVKLNYLIRHPYSIAKSYLALGWKKTNQFEARFSNEEINLLKKDFPDVFSKNFFYQIGFLQGLIEVRFKESGIKPICYEELVRDPIESYHSIFKKNGLLFTKITKEKIKKSLSDKK